MARAVELKLDFRYRDGEVVTAEVIETAVKCVMDGENDQGRKRVKEMSEKSRKAVMNGGSSFDSLGRLIGSLCNNLAPPE
ncbi:UDP-glycosyltransferase 71C3 [Morella rubra]|uniref:UDP-glycosyltransferase 71C3 n=1 Tax=Morella rubra TaxID=262757 RepID=A0A6A1UXS8_9ROSI|nr:UDP-glycosyltransferase 71C3 [Morella rubra]